MSAVLLATTSCSKKEESTLEQLSNLKAVAFAQVPDEVINSETLTQQKGQKVVRQTVKRQKVLHPIELIEPSDLEVIYPGSVLQGGAFMEGEYSPVTIKNPQEITLSATLLGQGLPVTKKSLPIPSQARQSVNDLLNGNRKNIDYDNTPSHISYISNEVSTVESFNKTFGIHAKASVYGGLVTMKFGYTYSKLEANNRKYVLIKVRQLFYNVTVDPKPIEEWGELLNVGEYEPVYISSVDYGRVAHLLIETEDSLDEISKTVEAGVGVNFTKVGGSIDVSAAEKLTKLFSQKKIKILISGGPLSRAKNVYNLKTFREFLFNPEADELVKSATPIGYKVRTLKDNREVEVRVPYVEDRIVIGDN